jgi:alkane 1-monooxygenase
LLLIASTWLGPLTGHPNLFTVVPLLVAYVLVPIVQDVWPRSRKGVAEDLYASGPWKLYYRLLPILSVPVQLAMLYFAGRYWVFGPLNGWGGAVLLLTTGVFSAMFAITIAHELVHRLAPLDRFAGGVLLSTVSFGVFKIVHIKIHHRFVGTPQDFETARRGQNIYAFWWQTLRGNVIESIQCERERLARAGQPGWKSELLVWYGLSAVWLLVAVALWGPWGGAFFLAQSTIAILQLQCVNFLQHYGLSRAVDSRGRAEPVAARHSWSQGLFLHDFLLISLPRHADHHIHPRRGFQSLVHDDAMPTYPYDYSTMVMVLLVPPLFRRVVHPRLDQLVGGLGDQVIRPSVPDGATVES